ncbi:MAG: RNA polymerase sigma factor [Acidimicrobiales bacterium]
MTRPRRPKPAPLTSEALASGLAAGDPAAAARLYEDYGRLVFAVAYRQLGRADLAQDAVQETMLRAWRAAERIDPARPVAPWLVTIARRAAIDIARREGRRATSPLQDAHGAEAPVDELERADTALAVRTAIGRLDHVGADLVRLHHFHGLTYAEMSERTHVPVGTLKSRSFRVHRQLQTLLADVA